jgi:hypothetical protein
MSYYKIYLNPRTEKFTIIELGECDEIDYIQSRFYSDNGVVLRWYDEEEAKQYLNDTFVIDKIENEYLIGSDKFWNQFKK